MFLQTFLNFIPYLTVRFDNSKVNEHNIIYIYILLHKKQCHIMNSHALTGGKPCFNKAIHALLMHG